MVFNATLKQYFSVISCRSVLLVEETRVPGENHRPSESDWQTLSHMKLYDIFDICFMYNNIKGP